MTGIFIAIVISLGTLTAIMVLSIYVFKSLDKENSLANQPDLNEYELLQEDLVDTIFEGVSELSVGDIKTITQNAAKFITERNMQFYRNGFENGVKATGGIDPPSKQAFEDWYKKSGK